MFFNRKILTREREKELEMRIKHEGSIAAKYEKKEKLLRKLDDVRSRQKKARNYVRDRNVKKVRDVLDMIPKPKTDQKPKGKQKQNRFWENTPDFLK